jgi:OmpA-OmpF porin, OOP family
VMSGAAGLRLVVDPIHFDFNAAVIKPISYPTLAKAGAALQNFPNYRVAIEGHTDDVGANDYNQRLSEERAHAVAEYLARNFGIGANRFMVKGYGEDFPIADNKTENGRGLNRRTEIVVLTNGSR